MAKYLFLLILAVLATAEQQEAASPVTAPTRSLPFGQLNFLHTTDVHGWHAGHLQEGQYSADYGDYISFIQRMREKTDKAGADLIVVDTGDRTEGNGLYDSSKPRGIYTYEIIKEVDYDVLIPGNHELYVNYTVDAEYSKISLATKERYLASNVDYVHPNTGKHIPLGQRYRVFKTKNQGIKVAAFGFLYDFELNSKNSVVQPVEDAVKESWFQKVIREDVDVFLVCGHIPLDGPEFRVILKAIRSQKKDTPVQIFGSHTHIRNFVKYDSKAAGLQSGRYLDTIGWASIKGLKKNVQTSTTSEIFFQRRYIDNNVLGFRFHTGLNAKEFPTEHGKNVTAFIKEARKGLDLNHLYGCIPRNFYYRRSKFPRNDSVATWAVRQFLPDVVKSNPQRTNATTFILIGGGFIRSDILKGPFTRDTSFTFLPFDDRFHIIKNIPYQIALDVIKISYVDETIFERKPTSPEPFQAKTPIQSRELRFKSTYWDRRTLITQNSYISSSKPQQLVPGYQTKDDDGTDGDDTIHLSLGEIHKPPGIYYASVGLPSKGEPETVDLVFNKYLTYGLITLLQSKGLEINHSNVKSFRKELIRDLANQWVKDNWADNCK